MRSAIVIRAMLLDWVVPPECPTASSVSAHVTAIVGEELARRPLSVRGRIEASAARRYRLDLRVGHDEVVRVIEADDCARLAEAAAVIVALDLQSHAETAPEAPNAAARRGPATPTEQRRRRAEPLPAPLPRTRRALHGGLGADVSIDVGSFPRAGLGAGAVGFLRYGAARGELTATLWPRSRADATVLAGAGAYVSLRTLSIRGCLTVVPKLDLAGCLRAEGGAVRATGFGISHPTTASGTWFGAFAGIAARPVSWYGVAPSVNLEVGTPLGFGAVDIGRVGEIHAPARVLLRLSVGVATTLF